MTEIIFESKMPEDEIIAIAAATLKSGGVIVVPTDTIPGIGCRADNHEAVKKLYALKDRPETLPVPVILSDQTDIKRFARNIPPSFDILAKRFWPGALTIVLESNGKIDPIIGGGLKTIGFRVPDSSLIRGIAKKSGFPLALTSANPHNEPPTAIHEGILKWWKDKVDLIILGSSMTPLPASAVVDLSVTPPKILREGLIDTDEICQLISC